MTEFKPIKEGKVREIYDNGDSLIMVATDRISAFDYILKNKITNKGKVLTQMSKFWFDYTRDVVPNHLNSVDKMCIRDRGKDERVMDWTWFHQLGQLEFWEGLLAGFENLGPLVPILLLSLIHICLRGRCNAHPQRRSGGCR